jgi:hypothetical protein
VERDTEIDQLKRELEILQTRYAVYRRSAQMWRGFFLVLIPVLPLALAIKLFVFDKLYGLFFVGAVLLFVGVITRSLKSSGIRWIDVATQNFTYPYLRNIYNPYFFYPNARPRPRSDAELLEWQIADRERRLSELGENVHGLKSD